MSVRIFSLRCSRSSTTRPQIHFASRKIAKAAMASSSIADNASTTPQTSSLVMQLIVDHSLIGKTAAAAEGADEGNWGLGPLMAQAAHASSAIIAQTLDRPSTRAYLAPQNLPHMRKIVLQTPKNVDLRQLSEALTAKEKEEGEDFPRHHLWIEMPEDIPTVLAIEPNERPPVSASIEF